MVIFNSYVKLPEGRSAAPSEKPGGPTGATGDGRPLISWMILGMDAFLLGCWLTWLPWRNSSGIPELMSQVERITSTESVSSEIKKDIWRYLQEVSYCKTGNAHFLFWGGVRTINRTKEPYIWIYHYLTHDIYYIANTYAACAHGEGWPYHWTYPICSSRSRTWPLRRFLPVERRFPRRKPTTS